MRDDIYSIRSDFKMCEFFYENPRNMKGARYKMLLICLGTYIYLHFLFIHFYTRDLQLDNHPFRI